VRYSNLRTLVAAGSLVAALGIAAGCGESTGAGTDSTTDTTAAAQTARSSVTLVSPDQAADLLETRSDLVLLDVRTPEEFDQAHLAGADLHDFYEPDFAQQLSELDPDAAYVVYCQSGNRSSQATALMAEMGFTEVYDVDGGIQSWVAAGLPVQTG
jgi:phage shock protein E